MLFGAITRWSYRLLFFVAGLTLTSLQLVAQATPEPNLEGSWSITFYLEPDHSEGGTQCVVFKTTNTQSSGEERNGTWTAPSFPGWHGEWFQDGDHAQWFGFTSDGLASSEFGHLPSNQTISGEFNHFLPPDGTTSSSGGWVAKRVEACDPTRSPAPRERTLMTPRSSDPANK